MLELLIKLVTTEHAQNVLRDDGVEEIDHQVQALEESTADFGLEDCVCDKPNRCQSWNAKQADEPQRGQGVKQQVVMEHPVLEDTTDAREPRQVDFEDGNGALQLLDLFWPREQSEADN